MDSRKQAIKLLVEEVAEKQQRELAAAGTLADLEELACQIGDEVTRLLTEKELARRSEEQAKHAAGCPDCGRVCSPAAEPEPVVLAGLRGTVTYSQPRHYCDRCRRSFFPSGRAIGDSATGHGDGQGAAQGRLGRNQ